MSEPTFDVVIYEMSTRKVESIIGKSMKREGTYYSAERRVDTAFSRINLDRYSACMVEAGRFAIGDVLP